MGFKNNFNQAFKELMRKEGFVGKNLSEESKRDSSLDGYLGQNAAPPVSEEQEYESYRPENEPESAPQPENNESDENAAAFAETRRAEESRYSNPESSYNTFNSRTPEFRQEAPRRAAPPQGRSVPEREETTVISKNMVITGGTVSGFANLKVDGGFKGDIKVTKDVTVTGTVVGTIECNNAHMNGSSVQGVVNTKGTLSMNRDSVLLGDAHVSNLDANGRIKGNIAVSGKAAFRSDAVILGDIVASTITIQDGAVIQGYVKTTFLEDDSSSNVFPEAITVDNDEE